jgi:hypothetical protein
LHVPFELAVTTVRLTIFLTSLIIKLPHNPVNVRHVDQKSNVIFEVPTRLHRDFQNAKLFVEEGSPQKNRVKLGFLEIRVFREKTEMKTGETH